MPILGFLGLSVLTTSYIEDRQTDSARHTLSIGSPIRRSGHKKPDSSNTAHSMIDSKIVLALAVSYDYKYYTIITCIRSTCVCEGNRACRDSYGVRTVPGNTPYVRRYRPGAVLGGGVDVSCSTGLPHP